MVARLAGAARRVRALLAGFGVALIGLTVTFASFAAVPARTSTLSSARDVRACLPLTDGRVIAATRNGLYRAGAPGEGRVWTVLDGLAGTGLHSIATVNNGGSHEYWVGGEGGVTRLKDDRGTLLVLGTLALSSVRALQQVGSRVYVGTWGDGLYKIDLATLRARRVVSTHSTYSTHSTRSTETAAEDDAADARRITSLWTHEGRLYVATAGAGLRSWDGRRFEAVPGIPSDAVVWSVGAHRGRLVVGTLEGAFERLGNQWRSVSTADVRGISDSGLLATFGQGVRALGSGRTSAATALPQEIRFAHGISENANGACVATSDGLWIRGGEGWTKHSDRAALAADIAALAHDRGRDILWVGGFDRGLSIASVVDGNVVVSSVRDATLGERINGIALAEDGSAWVATPRGAVHVSSARIGPVRTLQRIDRAHGLPDDDVHAVAVLRDGGIVLGTAKGAAIVARRARDEALSVRPLAADKSLPGLLNRAVWAIAEDRRGDGIWLGTSHGLLHWSAEGVRRYSQVSGHLSDDWVTSILDDGKGLWVGTYSRGVSRLERTDVDGGALTATHLGGGYVNLQGLLRRGKRLYVATMKGLLWRDAEAPKRDGEAQPWHRADGIATSADVTAVVPADATHVWIASRSGLVLAALPEQGP